MGKWKIIETVLFAAGALITAAKCLLKFIGYMCKLKKPKPKFKPLIFA